MSYEAFSYEAGTLSGLLTGAGGGRCRGDNGGVSATGETFLPIANLVGGGPFNLRPGRWTDDTSMALCLATSLIERGGFDAQDQMERYCNWRDRGYKDPKAQIR
ncbi:ADP-ribosylglycohydrolase family protein [Trichothermofontia sp.]